MTPVSIQPAARRDMISIAAYIAVDNAAAADRLIGEFESKYETLSVFPESGRARPDIGRGIRSVPVGNYTIYYRVKRKRVEVLRVLHAAMDVRMGFGP